MDGLFAYLAAKFGPITFGSFAGIIAAMIIDGISSLADMFMKIVLGLTLSQLFAKPLAHKLVTDYSAFFPDFEHALITAAGLTTLGGPVLVVGVRKWIGKKAEGGGK